MNPAKEGGLCVGRQADRGREETEGAYQPWSPALGDLLPSGGGLGNAT